MSQPARDLKTLQAELALYGLKSVPIHPGVAGAAPAANSKQAPAVKRTTTTPELQPANNDNDDDNDDDDSPSRPPIYVAWFDPKPKGSPGRKGYPLQKVLDMTDGDYGMVFDATKILLMRTKGIVMHAGISKQPYGLVGRIIRKLAAIFGEFDMYASGRYWPLKGFVHAVLRSQSNLYKERLKNKKKKKGKQSKAEPVHMELAGQETVEELPSAEDLAFEGVDVAFEGAGALNAGVAVEDDAMYHMAQDLTRMSLDPNESANFDQGEEDDDTFEMSQPFFSSPNPALTLPPASTVVPLPVRSPTPMIPPVHTRAPAPPFAQSARPAPAQTRASMPPAPSGHVPAQVATRASAPPQGNPALLAQARAPAPTTAHALSLDYVPLTSSSRPFFSKATRAPPEPTRFRQWGANPFSAPAPINTSIPGLPPVPAPPPVLAPPPVIAPPPVPAAVSDGVGSVDLLTPEVFAQLERLAACSAEMRDRLPPRYQQLLQVFHPLSSHSADPPSPTPQASSRPRPRMKYAPQPNLADGYESPPSDASASEFNRPVDVEDNPIVAPEAQVAVAVRVSKRKNGVAGKSAGAGKGDSGTGASVAGEAGSGAGTRGGRGGTRGGRGGTQSGTRGGARGRTKGDAGGGATEGTMEREVDGAIGSAQVSGLGEGQGGGAGGSVGTSGYNTKGKGKAKATNPIKGPPNATANPEAPQPTRRSTRTTPK
ncbi:hypothetical protein BDV93DRAFT_508595 [Ceratobasidium sp. AG-I]|nr:hypothetical protein BDV93DRAFT_508595 [Ceratobasidium sp. AG-I]